ncbi:SRPBCC family protein [Mycobacterium sp. IDR2000157661]|uniref:SRPBCC family protein n=1 Tax=Mycobacterium sp. IDR2000157661 TaxID=2867005 RepID=UPI001EECACE2|nr:SRPBCC family protein [Mycobacterium sp. IDR2000157661]ULE32905.1 SRPBCC family protein [Mycobacterium sp. IDR2000157661]
MARVDVSVEIIIRRPRSVVAAYAADPGNATAWYANIVSVRRETPPPLAVGSRFAFVARFLGRTLAYTYEVIEYCAERRFVMRTAEGPFPMQTSYEWDDADAAATRMTLRNQGEPSGFAGLAAPVIGRAMKRATTKDLERLKAILEST